MMRVFTAICLVAFGAIGQRSSPIPERPSAVGAGRAIFVANCASCHTGDGRNGRAPDLGAARFRGDKSDEELYWVIADGVKGSDMPAWAGRLKEDEIWRLVAFLRSPNNKETEVLGNAAKGEALFWGRGQCGNCHAVRGKGNHIGPDLTDIGIRRSVAYLRNSLTREGPAVLEAFQGVTVVTRTGQTITGIEKALDDFSVVLIDFSGKVYSFDREALKSIVREKRSLMPSYAQSLSDSERNDLMAWLAQ
jgi:putative heme-binding domain-containing protein